MTETPTSTADYLADPSDLAERTSLSADDPRLILELRRATERFRAEAGHHITQVTDDQVDLSGNGTPALTLPARPITSLTVTIDGTALTEGTDYVLGKRAGILRHLTGVWPDGLDNIQITYTHGYEQIPGDVADAILEAAEIGINIDAAIESAGSAGENVKIANSLINGGVTERWAATVARYAVNTNGDRS